MKWLLNIFTGGALDSILGTVEKHIEAQTDQNKVKADVIQTYLQTRAGFMEAGGFVLMLLYAIPAAFHFGSVAVYSVFWCADCAFPQDWTIAALPAREANWAGAIVLSIFGIVGLKRLK